MQRVRWSGKWHGRITAIVGILAGLMALTVAVDFGSGGTGRDEATAILVVAVTAISGLAVWIMIARYLDRQHPESGFVEACIRMLVPYLVVVAASAYLMNKGIYSDGYLIVNVAVGAAAVGLVRLFTARPKGGAATVGPAAAAVAPQITAGQPQWPTTMPTETPTQPIGSPAVGPATPAATMPATKARRAITHRVTSGIITLAWMPGGLLLLLLLNYCVAPEISMHVFVTTLLYVSAQLTVNPIAGWYLDRRYGNQGGTLVGVGRSVLVALIMMVVLAVILPLFVPDAPSRYCG